MWPGPDLSGCGLQWTAVERRGAERTEGLLRSAPRLAALHAASTAPMEPFPATTAAVDPTGSLNLIVLLAVAIPALGYLIKKVVIPGTRAFVRMIDDLKYLPVLEQIAAEFASDSGSTLKDQTNRIEEQLEANRIATEAFAARNKAAAEEFAAANREGIQALQIAVGMIQKLAESDRRIVMEQGQQLMDIVRSGIRTEASGARVEESGARTEASGVRTEASGARREAEALHVAEELAETRRAADDVPEDEAPGSAADAAAQSPESP